MELQMSLSFLCIDLDRPASISEAWVSRMSKKGDRCDKAAREIGSSQEEVRV